ncbi:MAG TPA: hypothetical protein VGQ57_04105 [Polyangiaceae bacterium]|jgi:hypothetical protein|nr:hypothetical protein [Polyangiaceae bacterium]
MSTVSCESVRDALLAGQAPDDSQFLAHAQTCAQCDALLADRASIGRALAEDPARSSSDAPAWRDMAALVEHESGVRAWLQSRPTLVRLCLAADAFAAVTAFGWLRRRSDFAALPQAEWIGLLACFGAVGLLALRQALPVMGRVPTATRGKALLLGVALLFPFVAAFGRTPTSALPPFDPLTFLRQAASCFGFGALLATPLFVLLWLLDRGAGSPSRRLFAAAAFGLAANAALTLHCSQASPAHLLLGHAGIGAALAAALLWVGRAE